MNQSAVSFWVFDHFYNNISKSAVPDERALTRTLWSRSTLFEKSITVH